MIKSKHLQKLVILLASMNLSQAMETPESAASQHESKTYEVCVRSSMTGELMEILQVPEKEIHNIQEELTKRYDKKMSDERLFLKYTFMQPELIEERIEINCVKSRESYLVVTDDRRHYFDESRIFAKLFPNNMSPEDEAFIHVWMPIYKQKANSQYGYRWDELSEIMGSSGNLYVEDRFLYKIHISFVRRLDQTIHVARDLSRQIGKSFYDSMKFLKILSQMRKWNMYMYSVTNPTNGLYQLNSIKDDTIFLQLLIENKRADRDWYTNYGEVMSHRENPLTFPDGSYVTDVMVGGKSHKFTDRLLANEQTFELIHSSLTGHTAQMQTSSITDSIHSLYQNIDLAEAMHSIR